MLILDSKQNVYEVFFSRNTGIGLYQPIRFFQHGKRKGQPLGLKTGRSHTVIFAVPDSLDSTFIGSAVCDIEDQDNPDVGVKLAFADLMKAFKNAGLMDRDTAKSNWNSFFRFVEQTKANFTRDLENELRKGFQQALVKQFNTEIAGKRAK